MMVRWILLGTSMVLASCATLDSRPPEEIVESRAAKHLDLLHQQQWADALEYTTPAFRSRTTPEQYAGRYGGVWMWQSTRVGIATCDGSDEPTSCEVQTYRTIVLPPHITTPLSTTSRGYGSRSMAAGISTSPSRFFCNLGINPRFSRPLDSAPCALFWSMFERSHASCHAEERENYL